MSCVQLGVTTPTPKARRARREPRSWGLTTPPPKARRKPRNWVLTTLTLKARRELRSWGLTAPTPKARLKLKNWGLTTPTPNDTSAFLALVGCWTSRRKTSTKTDGIFPRFLEEFSIVELQHELLDGPKFWKTTDGISLKGENNIFGVGPCSEPKFTIKLLPQTFSECSLGASRQKNPLFQLVEITNVNGPQTLWDQSATVSANFDNQPASGEMMPIYVRKLLGATSFCQLRVANPAVCVLLTRVTDCPVSGNMWSQVYFAKSVIRTWGLSIFREYWRGALWLCKFRGDNGRTSSIIQQNIFGLQLDASILLLTWRKAFHAKYCWGGAT